MTAEIPFDRRLTVPEHVASRDLDGELVLLNYDSETYFGLDEVGTRIWEVLQAAAIDRGRRRASSSRSSTSTPTSCGPTSQRLLGAADRRWAR